MNEHGYTRQNLLKGLPYTIGRLPEPVQFGPENVVDRVPKDHARRVTEAQRTLSAILRHIENGAGQGYVDCVAEVIYACEVTVYYVPSSWGYTAADMLPYEGWEE